MAVSRLTAFPASFQAGLTLRLTLTNTDLPASGGGTLTVNFNGPRIVDPTEFVITTDGDDFLIDVTAANTLKWKPGTYYYQVIHAGSAGSDLYATGQVGITPFVATTKDYDGRTIAKQTLDKIDELILGLVENPHKVMQWGDSIMTEKDLDSLRESKDYYQAIVNGEADAARIAAGEKPDNVVLMEFTFDGY